MRTLHFAFITGLLALAGVAGAQTPTQVRGAVATFDGKVVAVKAADGKTVNVQIDDNTEIVFTQPIKISEIKSGDFLGITSDKKDDGSLLAFEIRRFPKPLNPGHRPYSGRSDQTMTNATVSAIVQSSNNREITVTYDGGAQKITVPENASISMLVPGNRSQFVPNAPVFATAVSADGGGLVARRVQVSAPK
jgi:hypothetical protein